MVTGWKFLNPRSGTLSAETTIVPIDLQYNVTTNDQGAWTFTQNADKTKLPPMEDDPSHPGQKQLVLKKQNEQGQGLPVNIKTTGSYFRLGIFNEEYVNILSFSLSRSLYYFFFVIVRVRHGVYLTSGISSALRISITRGLAPVARSIWAMYQAHLSNSLSSLNSHIVMPVCQPNCMCLCYQIITYG